MPSLSSQPAQSRPARRLVLNDFESMAAELKHMRGSCISQAVLGFVRGLRLSARIIYFLRKYLSDLSLEVDWGHLVDTEENYLSRECDIIIHRAGFYQEWNDFRNPIMHFKFIKSEKTIAVISCKSLLVSIDSSYCNFMRTFVEKVFLFAECCPPRSITSLKRKAEIAGYAGFGYLYSYDKATGESQNDPAVWEMFLRKVREICEGDAP